MFEDAIPMGRGEVFKINGEPTTEGWPWKNSSFHHLTYHLRPFELRGLMCCGLREIASNNQTIYFSKTSTEKFIEKALSTDSGKATAGVLIATATQDQKEFKEWLLKIGFKDSIKKFYNPNSGNTVEVFLYDLPRSFKEEEEEDA